MSFSYSGNPANSTLDFIRFTVGDTNANQAVLQDEEINWIVAEYPELNKQLAAAFRQMATSYSSIPKRRLGPMQEDGTDRAAYFKERAMYYETRVGMSGIPPLPEYSSDKVFDKGMMANDE